MARYDVRALPTILNIGITGANKQKHIEFDISSWKKAYPDAVFAICVIRPGEDKRQAYFGTTEIHDEVLVWTIHNYDLGNINGYGAFEVWAKRPDATINDVPFFKSKSVITQVVGSIADTANEEVPVPIQPYAEQIFNSAVIAQTAQIEAENARDDAIAAKNTAQEISENISELIPPGGNKDDVLTKNEDGTNAWKPLESRGLPFDIIGDTLFVQQGVLNVKTADIVEQDNTLPVTAAAVYTEVGNINVLLSTI